MQNDAYEDFMPRNAPKPTPLIEVAAVPSVPEVSLLFDTDKAKMPGQQPPSNIHHVANNERQPNDYLHMHKQDTASVPGLLMRNQHESYNTWKARNAQALQIITGSAAGKIESQRKNIRSDVNGLGSKDHRSADDFNRQSMKPMERMNHTVPQRYEAQVPVESYSSGVSPMQNGHQTVEKYSSGVPKRHESQTQMERYPPGDPHPQRYETHRLQNIDERGGRSESHSTPRGPSMNKTHLNSSSPRDHLRDEIRMLLDEYKVELGLDGQHDRGQFENNVSKSPHDRVRRDPRRQEVGDRGCESRGCCAPPPPPVCACQHLSAPAPSVPAVNERQITDLYNIIHLQNEQILLLQQQVKQVLRIHLDCGVSAERGLRHECPCEKKEAAREEKKVANAAAEVTSPVAKSTSARTIGVMTSLYEAIGPAAAPRSKRETRPKPVPEPRKARRKPTAPAGFGRVLPEQDGGRLEVLDDSFSLDEERLALRLRPQAEAQSPDTSVHVDLQDYCSTSDSGSESYDSEETDVDGEGESGRSCKEERSESEPSEPQLGWTFYNQVVGQVNNILKKPARRRSYGRSGKRQQWEEAEAGDMFDENNWSKRVTFNGDSPGVKNNNLGHQGYNRPNGPGGVGVGGGAPDHLLMYNTNLSFGTLGYLQRYNLLPDHLLKAYGLKPNGQGKASQKTQRRSNEGRSNRRSNATAASSKLLDVTALKRQPKLF